MLWQLGSMVLHEHSCWAPFGSLVESGRRNKLRKHSVGRLIGKLLSKTNTNWDPISFIVKSILLWSVATMIGQCGVFMICMIWNCCSAPCATNQPIQRSWSPTDSSVTRLSQLKISLSENIYEPFLNIPYVYTLSKHHSIDSLPTLPWQDCHKSPYILL